jgi:hypothetical protein
MTATDQIMAAKAELKNLLSARRKRYMACPRELIEGITAESQADVLRFHLEDIETANKKGRLRR